MLKKITLIWKKNVRFILGFLGIGTLVSCYGMPITENPLGGKNYLLQGCVYGDINGDGESERIPNIQVSSNYGTTKTNENGEFKILGYTEPENVIYKYNSETEEYNYNVKKIFIALEFNDIDGEKNGNFKSMTYNAIVNRYGTLEDFDSLEDYEDFEDTDHYMYYGELKIKLERK